VRANGAMDVSSDYYNTGSVVGLRHSRLLPALLDATRRISEDLKAPKVQLPRHGDSQVNLLQLVAKHGRVGDDGRHLPILSDAAVGADRAVR
jgi:hypothetical protein